MTDEIDLSKRDQLEPVVTYEFPDQDAHRRRGVDCVPRAGDRVMHNQRLYLVADVTWNVTWNVTHTQLAIGVRCVKLSEVVDAVQMLRHLGLIP